MIEVLARDGLAREMRWTVDGRTLGAPNMLFLHSKGLPHFSRGECFLSADGPVEDRFTLLYEGVERGHIGLNRFVELVATRPAKMFGMYPRKGTIAPGSDADIVVFDPKHERVISAETHHMNVDYSCFEGLQVKGLPEIVMQRGAVLVKDRIVQVNLTFIAAIHVSSVKPTIPQ